MITPAEKDLTVYQGATFVRSIRCQWNDDGATSPLDPTGWTARMQLREKHASTSPLLSLTTENGGIIYDVIRDGSNVHIETRLVLTMTAAQTAALTSRKARYDLEVVDPSGNVSRIWEGVVIISPEVTR